MTFNSIEEMKTYIINKSKGAVQQAKEFVFKTMEDVLIQFYEEYDPSIYNRTFQMLCCCVQTDVIPTANGWVAEIYFDSSKMNYTTDSQPSGESVLEAAKFGRHGAMGLAVVDFKGTPIMEESVIRLSKKIYPLIKSALIANGIPVR